MAITVDIRDRLPHWSGGLRLLNQALARDFTEMTKSHLFQVANQRHGLGGSKNYYGTAADETRGDLNGNEILIRIQQIGMQTKYSGKYSAIKPNAAKWLSIPATAEAYGRRAWEFDNLRFVKFGDNLAALIVGKGGTGRYERGGIKFVKGSQKLDDKGRSKVMYWLKQTLHDAAPDHAIIPDESAFLGQASVTVNRVVEALRSGRRTLGGLGGTP